MHGRTKAAYRSEMAADTLHSPTLAAGGTSEGQSQVMDGLAGDDETLVMRVAPEQPPRHAATTPAYRFADDETASFTNCAARREGSSIRAMTVL